VLFSESSLHHSGAYKRISELSYESRKLWRYMLFGVVYALAYLSPYTRHPGCALDPCDDLLIFPQASSHFYSTRTMSKVPSTTTSSTNVETIISAALEEYKKMTKKDIASHPLAAELKSCESTSAILAILRAQVQTFDRSRSADEKLTKWLDPTVNVLFAFSSILGDTVGLVIPRFKAARDVLSDVCHRYFHLRV
jgi:hypothetical protein